MIKRIVKRWKDFNCRMGSHYMPKLTGHDGCSATGTCPNCGKDVLQDSQGNWF